MKGKRDPRSDTICDEFKSRGYKITTGRKVILDALSKSGGHLTAEDIFERMRPAYPHIGLATIYRMLNLSVEIGVVRKSEFGDGSARYELTRTGQGSKNHSHYICTRCKSVFDTREVVNAQLARQLEKEKERPEMNGFNVTDHAVHFYGVCRKCTAKYPESRFTKAEHRDI